MKFSVLLPTRNRLRFLKYAVETVRRQDYGDWEIIISDNDSEDDIEGFVRSLQDDRILYVRTDRFLPVTDNWNRALIEATGEYIIMLGDDDGLMPGYFTTMKGLIEKHFHPDLIFNGAYIYAYPGVLPDHPNGHLQLDENALFKAPAPYILPKNEARRLAEAALEFKMLYPFNMQYSLMSSQLVKKLAGLGPFYQSPYPDYYATNLLFFKAGRILIVPQPLVAICITPKSYGFYHFNHREGEGAVFLNNAVSEEDRKKLERVLLPGNCNNTSWLVAMETLKRNLGHEMPLNVKYRRYRLFQIFFAYKNYYLTRRMKAEEFRILKERLHPQERIFLGLPLRAFLALVQVVGEKRQERIFAQLRKLIGKYEDVHEIPSQRSYRSIMEVFESAMPAG